VFLFARDDVCMETDNLTSVSYDRKEDGRINASDSVGLGVLCFAEKASCRQLSSFHELPKFLA
jgi:hypothetical protein